MKLGLGKQNQKAPPEMSPEATIANRLKELCGDDDFYGAMSRLMFLDPKRITTPLDRVLAEAQESEAQGNKLRAEVGYRIAGGIALYRGQVADVRKYFEKAASFAGDSHPEYQIVLKRSDEAVSVAKKYYDEFGSLSARA